MMKTLLFVIEGMGKALFAHLNLIKTFATRDKERSSMLPTAKCNITSVVWYGYVS